MSESLLSVRDVTSGYGSLMVLHGMTFDILPGEAVGIVGPNGAGKSTLLKTIAGALPTGRGSIALAGTSIERTSAARRVGHGIALVPEGRQVIRDLSVQGNLDVTLLGRRAHPRPRAPRPARVGLHAVPAPRRTAPGQGRLAVRGRAADAGDRAGPMSKPRLLLLDEPSLGLAPAVVAQLVEVLDGIPAR